MAARPRDARWGSEARFFDDLAGRVGGAAELDPAVIARYARWHRPWFQKEYCFGLVRDVRGKAVLDVGCGLGDDAILLACQGAARVLAVDISPRSIEVARRRARCAGVDDRVEFVCAPFETLALPERTFDLVWGDGVLHHLIPELDGVLAALRRSARPGARFVFIEPVSFLRALRWLRRKVPIHTDATPDERPLERPELAIVARHLPGVALRHYGLFSRLNRFVMRGSYEHAPAHRRALVNLSCALDAALLAVPLLRPASSMAVLSWRAPRGEAAGAAERAAVAAERRPA